ncbi:hypothetical protein Nepgr_000121 [Nepenthes gracilis]|uniref:Pentatricopeptide repeat-containing protein n=1 Tax=Nepenthes gracilis TaxID=150966 RepID=A0AAD3P5X9_NEPGR|nr:hypothetical protein Nepgr_000121 [Nepenthes gracilis]
MRALVGKAASSTARHKTHIAYRLFQTSSEAYLRWIENCADYRSLLSGRAVHGNLIVNGLARLTHFASKLIAMYAECGELPVARKLFDEIPKRNYRRWIVLLGAYAKCGFYREALILFWEMQREGIRPNNYVLPSVLKACGHLTNHTMGKKMHCFILRCSYEHDAFVNSALIDMYAKCALVDNARRVFDGMLAKDLVGLNAMVSGYVHAGLVKEALCLVERTQLAGSKPNVVTWNTLVGGFSQAGIC